jgi:4'-phosphopantetheinyl transferase
LALRKSDVHVWATRLDLRLEDLQSDVWLLGAAERERAARFHFDRDRIRFLATRIALRKLLSLYLKKAPAQFDFHYGTNGKPFLPHWRNEFYFNVAHSEEVALIALTRFAEVGIDVEKVRPLPDAQELVARFFSPREAAAFRALPGETQGGAFFNLWTRKEAWLKAVGEGIAHSLNLVEVSFLPGEPARLLNIAGDRATAVQWTLRDLAPAGGYTAALATQAGMGSVYGWHWPAGGIDPLSLTIL